ncbi:MAG: hypothetical protein ACERKZ_03130 [Lachnotalea sp.]
MWDKLYKRQIIFDNNILFPENLAYEDMFWGAIFYLYVNKVYILEENLYHYFINSESTVLMKNKEYHFDMLTANYLKWEDYIRRGAFEKYKEALEYDFIITYYFTGIKMLFLRFDEVPYVKYMEIQNTILKLIPNFKQNKYLIKNTSDLSQILLDLIGKKISKEELELIAKSFREISDMKQTI